MIQHIYLYNIIHRRMHNFTTIINYYHRPVGCYTIAWTGIEVTDLEDELKLYY